MELYLEKKKFFIIKKNTHTVNFFYFNRINF
jgi:hypothetical protein